MPVAASAIYFLNLRGDVLINRLYRDDVGGNMVDAFRTHIMQTKDLGTCPVRQIGGCSFLYMRISNVYIVTVVSSNANAACAFKFVVEAVALLKSYFGGAFDEDAIRNNFVLIYELLDEIMDFGYPQNLSSEILKLYITQEGVRSPFSKKPQDIRPPANATLQVTGAVGWRREGLVYKKNERVLDDHEKPSVTPREFDGWGSKDVIEFVKYMDEDPKKPLSRVQVTKLLWTYINTQKLQGPRKKTQIVCDDRPRTIFGKKIVGQSEMFKLLQSHFAPKGRGRAGRQIRDEQVGIEEEEVGDADETSVDERLGRMKDVKDTRRRRKSEEEKFERPSVNEYAAVTPKNIGLIYLRRQLLEELLDDPEFERKVCNTFVRIRVPGMISKSEMCYRLVQVAGTRLQAEHYKAGRKVTNVLEILNLQKREDVTVDLVSNHDFSEEECQRLRQSMKYGFIKALTVGDIEEKSKSLQEARVNDWFETERQRLVNFRDRASEKGRKKELRECVEKLQEQNSPAFRAAKLHAIPEVTADPRMDPDYESDANDDKAKEGMSNNLDKSFSTPGDKVLPAGILKGSHNSSSREWEGTKSKQPSWGGGDSYRSKDGDRLYDSSRSSDKQYFGQPSHNYGVDNTKERGYEERGWGSEHHNNVAGDAGWMGNGRNRPTPGAQRWNENVDLFINVDARSGRSDYRGMTDKTTPVFDTKSDWQSRRESAPGAAPSLPQTFPMSPGKVSTQATIEAAEKEKGWHYMDPTGMVQGPFAMEQLRKWNTRGYFPEDLKIWKTAQPGEESILLTDGLPGRFQEERESWGCTARIGNPVLASIQEEIAQALTTSSTLPFNNDGGRASVLQPYQNGYEAPPRPPQCDVIPLEFGGEWGITGSYPLDLRERQLLAVAAAERHLLDAEYDEYPAANASGAACCRSAALILMALLLLRHALIMAAAGTDEDTSIFFTLFFLRAAGFLLPCYIMARAMNILQRRRQRQEAAMAAAEVAILLQQAGQARGMHFAVSPGPAPAHELP